ncbi:helix-turn-helix domain-containing protein [Yinghuangia sp. YIM S09857]|uniref:helix-turn-helix domain-containing protein n=1 Tax=Yinghuangia sp. YIM S09857 TaxID=3436929 RepID=UPI003F53486C
MPAAKELDPEASMWALFGAHLRFYRQRAELTQARLGTELHATGSFVGQIETAERRPHEEFVAQLDERLDAKGLLIATAVHAAKLTDDQPGWFDTFANAEAASRRIRTFQPQVIPGLLQCEEYMRTLLSRARVPHGTIDKWVARRLARKSVLTKEDAPEYWAVVDEAALLRLCTNQAVAKVQVTHLLDVIALNNVILEMVPMEAGLHACMDGAFVLLTVPGKGECTYAEGTFEGRMSSDQLGVAEVQRRYDLLRADTLSPERTRQHLRDLLEGMA